MKCSMKPPTSLKEWEKFDEADQMVNHILQEEPLFFQPRLDKADELLEHNQVYDAYVAYWDCLRRNPKSSRAFKGLALSYNSFQSDTDDPLERPLYVTAGYNYAAWKFNPQDTSPLYSNAMLYLIDNNPFAVKFWYDMWAELNDKDPVPLDEIHWLKTMETYSELDDENAVNELMWQIYQRYPTRNLYFKLREIEMKDLRLRRPRWFTTDFEDNDVETAIMCMDDWIEPDYPAYLYDIEEDYIV